MTAATSGPAPVELVTGDEEIMRCFPLMQQLRPHLRAEDFLARIRRQIDEGYRLAMIRGHGTILALAGFRIRESLFQGRFLYVDDLVTDSKHRSRGFGRAMLNWLYEKGRAENCGHIELDSGVQRLEAHRFYEREGMSKRAYHFSRAIEK